MSWPRKVDVISGLSRYNQAVANTPPAETAAIVTATSALSTYATVSFGFTTAHPS